MDVNDLTHEELLTLTSQINQKSKAELQIILDEAERAGKRDILKETWKQDVEDRILFQRDQKRIVS